MPSVTLAFSVFWAMDAVICSIDEVVSSTEAACSLDDCESDWAVAETWLAALVRLSAAVRTSPMIWVRRPIMFCMAFISSPTSSLLSDSRRTVRSPSDKRVATPTASLIGRVIERVIHSANPVAMRAAAIRRIMIRVRVLAASASASLPAFSISVFCRSFSFWRLSR